MSKRTSNSFGYCGLPVKSDDRKSGNNMNRPTPGQRGQHGQSDQIRQRRKFPTNYYGIIRRDPPPIPPLLARGLTADETESKKKEFPGVGKVKILLRVNRSRAKGQDLIRVEGNKKHVSVFMPDPQSKQKHSLAPKVYAFDAIFTEETTQAELCKTSLVDVIQSVMQGADGTVFCYGQANVGKTFALLGRDDVTSNLGLIPCAISWLYRAIQASRNGNNYSVKVSAIEVYGKSEKLRDLLAGYCEDGPARALGITEDLLLGTKLQNQCEIKANTAERAAYLLDAALASRSCAGSRNTSEARKHSHVVYTLHVYNHSSGKADNRRGEKSRLNFVDLGSCDKTLIKTPSSLALSLTSLGHVIMSILNNSKHVPFRESKLTCVLKETLSNVNCRVVMIAHVSDDITQYTDTLSTIQLASRIHRVIKKKNKSNAAEVGGANGSHLRSKYLRQKSRESESVGSSSGMECTSGSELSCDTVVYVNKNGVPMSDRELTDNEGPPESLPIRPRAGFPNGSSPISENEMVYNLSQAKVRAVQDGNGDSRKDVKSPGCNVGRSKIPSRVKNGGRLSNRNNNQGCPADNTTHSVKQNYGHETQKCNQQIIDRKDRSYTNSRLQNPRINGVKSGKKDVLKPNKPPRANPSSLDSKPSSMSTSSSPVVKKKSMLVKPQQRKRIDYGDENRPNSQPGNSCRKAAPAPPKRSSSVACKERRNNENINLSNIERKQNSKMSFKSNIAQPGARIGVTTGMNSTRKCQPMIKNNKKNKDHTYENVVCYPDYSNPHGERPEPVGCDDDESLQSICDDKHLDVMKKLVNEKRPESLHVNFDDGEWGISDDEHDNSSVVDVNFYCLTFTSRNPLTPLSRRIFSQQIQQNRRKSMSDTSDGQSYEVDSEYASNMSRNDKKIVEDENMFTMGLAEQCGENVEHCISEEKSTSHNLVDGRNQQTTWQDLCMSDDGVEAEDIFDEPEIKQMPKLECCYTHNDRASMSVSHPPTAENECRTVLYDSNSLEMSYLDTRQWLPESSEVRKYGSPDQKSTPQKQIPKKGFKNQSVIITKSTSQEGARLTLIKKKKGTGSTLELMITDEEPLSYSNPQNLVNCNPINVEVQSINQTIEANKPKRSRWSGLRKFSGIKNSNKSPKKTVGGKSFVSKILTPKLRRSANVKELVKVR